MAAITTIASVWLAGGGVKGGTVYGATDEFGFAAAEEPMHIHDLHATLLALMGFDHEQFTFRHAGRDFHLTDVHGNVVDNCLTGLTGWQGRDVAGIHPPSMQVDAQFTRPAFLGAGHENLSPRTGGIDPARTQILDAGHPVHHDVVNQQDWRRTVDAGEVFRLGQFQGEGQGAFGPRWCIRQPPDH